MKAFSHERVPDGKEEWLTPRWMIERLGPFDLDPCSPVVRPWPTAKRHLTVEDDGLSQPWDGVVWLNPPYGQKTGVWVRRLREHGLGIALILARTHTAWFQDEVFFAATALLWIRGRIQLHHVTGEPAAIPGAAPSVLVAYGPGMKERLYHCCIPGKVTDL